MARREVIEINCDRCGGKDLQDKAVLQDVAELEVTFHGKKTIYKDLCIRCRCAVEGYFLRMTKQEPEAKKEDGTNPPPNAPAAEGEKKKGLFGR
jgi:hypothetical protein